MSDACLKCSVKDCDRCGKGCAGLIFRLRVSSFINSKRHHIYQERMVPMKRMSCPGCCCCGAILEDLRERHSLGCYGETYSPQIDKIVNGGLYNLEVTNINTDWETGIVDDWDLEYKLMQPKQPHVKI